MKGRVERVLLNVALAVGLCFHVAAVLIEPQSLVRREDGEGVSTRRVVKAERTSNETAIPLDSGGYPDHSVRWSIDINHSIPVSRSISGAARNEMVPDYPSIKFGWLGDPDTTLVRHWSVHDLLREYMHVCSIHHEVRYIENFADEIIAKENDTTQEDCFRKCRSDFQCLQASFSLSRKLCFRMDTLTKQVTRESDFQDWSSLACGCRTCLDYESSRRGGAGNKIAWEWHELSLGSNPLFSEKSIGQRKKEKYIPWEGCRLACKQHPECKEAVWEKSSKMCEMWSQHTGYDECESQGCPFKGAACGMRLCTVFLNERKVNPRRHRGIADNRPLLLNVSTDRTHGAPVESWDLCLRACMSDAYCLQTVYDKNNKRCYPVAEAGMASDVDAASFNSAHCSFENHRLH